MLELEEALEKILAVVPPPVEETALLSQAHGRVVTQEALSPVDLPGFDNSAMDGYAVRAADLSTAQAEAPVLLRLAGRVAAGEVFTGEVTTGTCVRLFTGSPLPRGADAVVMQEDTRTEPHAPGQVSFLAPVEPGESIRRRGEDIARESVLIGRGETVTPAKLALLAAAGVGGLTVGRRPLVGLLATGSELREAGQPLAPGQIYESNRPSLAALTASAGALPKIAPLIPDELAATRVALEQAFDQGDAVVTSGGVSVGELDFVKQAFVEMGGELQFWRVAVKPGRPFVFGRYGAKLLFGLPGNPVSAFVTFLLLVRPALRRWQGAVEVALPTHPGTLAEPLSNPGERRHFMRVTVDSLGQVRSAGPQASHVLSSLASANGLVDVPPRTELPAGSAVRVMRWE